MSNPKLLGRDFERIVYYLELLAADGARVEFDAHLPDRVTGELRQVDIAVWIPSHHGEILYVIDCKDYSKRVDVMTIEQLALKSLDIGAARSAIVTRNGFSGPAIKKANFHKIDLLTVLQNDDWPSWLKLRHIELINLNAEIRQIEFIISSESTVAGTGRLPDVSTDIHVLASITGDRYSINDITRLIIRNLYGDLIADSTEEFREARINLEFANGPLRLMSFSTPVGLWAVGARILLAYRQVSSMVPLVLEEYIDASDRTIVSALVSSVLPLPGKPQRLYLARNLHEDGNFELRAALGDAF